MKIWLWKIWKFIEVVWVHAATPSPIFLPIEKMNQIKASLQG